MTKSLERNQKYLIDIKEAINDFREKFKRMPKSLYQDKDANHNEHFNKFWFYKLPDQLLILLSSLQQIQYPRDNEEQSKQVDEVVKKVGEELIMDVLLIFISDLNSRLDRFSQTEVRSAKTALVIEQINKFQALDKALAKKVKQINESLQLEDKSDDIFIPDIAEISSYVSEESASVSEASSSRSSKYSESDSDEEKRLKSAIKEAKKTIKLSFEAVKNKHDRGEKIEEYKVLLAEAMHFTAHYFDSSLLLEIALEVAQDTNILVEVFNFKRQIKQETKVSDKSWLGLGSKSVQSEISEEPALFFQIMDLIPAENQVMIVDALCNKDLKELKQAFLRDRSNESFFDRKQKGIKQSDMQIKGYVRFLEVLDLAKSKQSAMIESGLNLALAQRGDARLNNVTTHLLLAINHTDRYDDQELLIKVVKAIYKMGNSFEFMTASDQALILKEQIVKIFNRLNDEQKQDLISEMPKPLLDKLVSLENPDSAWPAIQLLLLQQKLKLEEIEKKKAWEELNDGLKDFHQSSDYNKKVDLAAKYLEHAVQFATSYNSPVMIFYMLGQVGQGLQLPVLTTEINGKKLFTSLYEAIPNYSSDLVSSITNTTTIKKLAESENDQEIKGLLVAQQKIIKKEHEEMVRKIKLLVKRVKDQQAISIDADYFNASFIQFLIDKGELRLLQKAIALVPEETRAEVFKYADINGLTLIHKLAIKYSPELLTGFISLIPSDKKAEILNLGDYQDKTALHYAATRSNNIIFSTGKKITSILLENGANAAACDYSGKTPLHHAAETGRAKTLSFMVSENNGFVNKADKEGQTPLHLASKHNNRHSASILLEGGSNPYLLDKNDKTALEYGLERGRSFFKLMVKKAKFYCRFDHELSHDDSTKGFFSLLTTAIKSRVPNFVLEAITKEKKFDFEAIDQDGNNALHVAVKNGDKKVVELLLKHGADAIVDKRNNQGKTPRDLAKDNPDIAKIFSKIGLTPVENLRDVASKVRIGNEEDKLKFERSHLMVADILAQLDQSIEALNDGRNYNGSDSHLKEKLFGGALFYLGFYFMQSDPKKNEALHNLIGIKYKPDSLITQENEKFQAAINNDQTRQKIIDFVGKYFVEFEDKARNYGLKKAQEDNLCEIIKEIAKYKDIEQLEFNSDSNGSNIDRSSIFKNFKVKLEENKIILSYSKIDHQFKEKSETDYQITIDQSNNKVALLKDGQEKQISFVDLRHMVSYLDKFRECLPDIIRKQLARVEELGEPSETTRATKKDTLHHIHPDIKDDKTVEQELKLSNHNKSDQ